MTEFDFIKEKNLKNTQIGQIPENWKIVALNNLGQIGVGKTPSRTNEKYWNGPINFITPSDLTDSKYVYNSKNTLTIDGAKYIGVILSKNTILIVSTGSSIGKISMAYNNSSPNQHITYLICNDGVDPNYIYYSLFYRRTLLKRYSTASTIPFIRKSVFELFNIPIPNFDEQVRISSTLSLLDKKIDIEKKEIEKIMKLKNGIMRSLLEGKIRLK